jgi:hypothetical protein
VGKDMAVRVSAGPEGSIPGGDFVNYLALMIAWPFASLFAMMPFCALVRAGQEDTEYCGSMLESDVEEAKA